MSILPILKMGHPSLLRISRSVDLSQEFDDVSTLVQNMTETFNSLGERVGLAAPQIGAFVRVLIIRIPKNNSITRYDALVDEDIPLTALINPSFSPLSEEKENGWEACISVPNMMGMVPRYKHISFSYETLEGQKIESHASGFHARVIQHEYDHLDGILYPQRIEDFRLFGFEEEIVRYVKSNSPDFIKE